MRWTSWLPQPRSSRFSVLGFDLGPEVCSLVVLTGSPSQPDSVCCAERLDLPEGLVAEGEVLRSQALGLWLKSFLEAGDYQPEVAYFGLDGAVISNHLVTLAAGLSPADVSFQLQAEVQSLMPVHVGEVCIDFTPDTAPSPTGRRATWCKPLPSSWWRPCNALLKWQDLLPKWSSQGVTLHGALSKAMLLRNCLPPVLP